MIRWVNQIEAKKKVYIDLVIIPKRMALLLQMLGVTEQVF